MSKDHDHKRDSKSVRISIADFEIESESHTLEELEDCMNRLIEKNKDFAQLRRVKRTYEGAGMFG